MEVMFLVIDNDDQRFNKCRKEYEKYGIKTLRVLSMQDAIKTLEETEVIIIGINGETIIFMPLLNILRIKTNAPIILYTSNPTFNEQRDALVAGVDHYLKWNDNPEECAELGIIIMKRYMERGHKKPCQCLYHKGILLIPEYRKIFINDTDIELTRKEFDLLALLMSDTKRVFTYDNIYKAIWGDNYIDIDKCTVWNLVKRLRHKIQVDPDMQENIKNVHDIGYAFER